MDFYGKVFSRVNYKVWMVLIPLIGLLLMPFAFSVKLGIDFTGGTEIQILTDRAVSAQQFQSALSQCSTDIRANVQNLEGRTTAIIKSKDAINKSCSDSALATIGFSEEELAKVLPSTFKPELGKTLLEQGSKVFIIAGVLMMAVIFIAFRSIIPSIAVIQAAVFDIAIGLGLLSLLGFELSLAGFAALLMLVGYSVDDNIVLTSNVLNERGKSLGEQVNKAFATGITMTGTSIAGLTAILIVAFFVQMETVSQIATVLVAGLMADFFTTWFVNVAVLEWYLRRKPAGTKSSRFKFTLFRS